jgi:flavin-dependent dehydrogenase
LLPAPAFGTPTIKVCGSARLDPCAGPGWIAIGDAAATLQPLTSAGVAKALRDARLVPQALRGGAAAYDRLQAGEFRAYLNQLAQHYALEQ